MGCWVAPTIAAELWGLSLSDVLSLIRTGQLPIQHSGGFSFVRFPTAAKQGQSLPSKDRPATFNLVPASEPEPRPAASDSAPAPTTVDENESELGPPPDEDPNDNRIADWRAGRRAASNRRRPPKM